MLNRRESNFMHKARLDFIFNDVSSWLDNKLVNGKYMIFSPNIKA